MKTFGIILMIVGAIGVIYVLSLAAHWLFGWAGVIFLISILSVCAGLAIYDDYMEE